LDYVVGHRGVRRRGCAHDDGIHAGLGQVGDRVEQRKTRICLGHLDPPGLRTGYDAGQHTTRDSRDEWRVEDAAAEAVPDQPDP
jgi:hypothetical protein